MKCLLFLLSVLLTILASTHSFEMVLEQVKDGATLPASSAMDTTQTSETSIDDSVPVLSQPEVMISTLPMTETVLPSQMMLTDPVLTDTASGQTLTEAKEEIVAERTMPRPVVTEYEEVDGRGWSDTTAMDVLKKIYEECVRHGSFACVKPKVLSFLSTAVKKDKVMLTDDLIVEKTGRVMKDAYEFEQPQQVGSALAGTITYSSISHLHQIICYCIVCVCVCTYESIIDRFSFI
jgi:hypothetical protein